MINVPTVSYVITVYNKAPFLPYVIAGLTVQEGDFEREFIFVDDGSTDDSVECLERLTPPLGNVTIIRQDNRGPALATNAGIDAATGDYIKLVDGDDILLPWTTQVLMDAMKETGCRVAYGRLSREYRTDQEGGPAAFITSYTRRPGPVTRDRRKLVHSLKVSRINPSRMMATAEIVREVGGCDPTVIVQDYSIELRLANAGHFAFVDEIMCISPSFAPGRVSENAVQTLHDLNMSLAGLLRDYPEIAWRYRWYAHQRAASRAWKWTQRHGSRADAARAFIRFTAARLGLLPATHDAIDKTSAIFRKTANIRIPDIGADYRSAKAGRNARAG
jgi:hypothetical protein